MKKIFRVFLSDVKRLSTNVVAVVIIMGLSIIPALYAWFNILSNWDPYGQSATSQMNIAVFSEDEGVAFGGLSVNIGDSVIDGLKANDTIGWVFSETREDALQGVYSGEYYAALIVPESFTADMISFLGGEPENPQIEYYENSKKNAIATKITSKVKNTVQQQVNTSFVSTLAEVLSESGEFLTDEEVNGNTLLESVLGRLEEMNSQLDTYVSILHALGLVTDSANGLVDSTRNLIPGMEGMIDGGQGALSSMQSSVLQGAQTADTVASMMDICLDSVISGLDTLETQLEVLDISSDYSSLVSGFDATSKMTDATLNVIKNLMGEENEAYIEALDSYQQLEEDVGKLSEDADMTQEKLEQLKAGIREEITSCKNAVKNLKNTFDYDITPDLKESVYEVEQTLIEAQTLLSGLDGSFSGIDQALQAYSDTLMMGTDGIAETEDHICTMQEGLQNIIDELQEFSENEEYQEIAELLQTDPQLIADFVSSPVVMETETMYEIENYGSAMAPFYTVLGLWVGALILVALIHVKVEDEDCLKDVRPWHKFFGRYLSFFVVGQLQTLLVVLGDLFYIGIQCKHPFLFWLASAVISMVFTFFIYSLTVALGNIGEALAVVIMVIQVAGAGCTFPIEVLPEIFRSIYKVLPFVYSMDALKECVGGMYQLEYGKDLGILGIYLIVSLIIGLFLGKPFVKLNQIIERSKEKSGIML